MKPIKVSILGAGISGLNCANTIYKQFTNEIKQGVLKLKILEADSSLGGRLRDTTNIYNSIPNIELGGVEVEKCKHSPYLKKIAKLKQKVKLHNFIKDINSHFCMKRGKNVPYYRAALDNNFLINHIENVKERLIKNKDLIKETSLLNYLKKWDSKYSSDNYLYQAYLANDMCSDLANIKLQPYIEYLESEIAVFKKIHDLKYHCSVLIDSNHRTNLSKIYDKILAFINYNQEITKISLQHDDGNIVLLNSNSDVVDKSDFLIITIPINKVKELILENLNDQEDLKIVNSVKSIEMGEAGKFVMKFKNQFWDKNISWLITDGLIKFYFNNNLAFGERKSNENYLTGLAVGENTNKIENLYNKDKHACAKIIMKDLEKTFCISNLFEFNLEDFFWYNWSKNPFIKGGFSRPSIPNDLRLSIADSGIYKKRILFGGEAFARELEQIATIDGALGSGKHSANIAINEIKKLLN